MLYWYYTINSLYPAEIQSPKIKEDLNFVEIYYNTKYIEKPLVKKPTNIVALTKIKLNINYLKNYY